MRYYKMIVSFRREYLKLNYFQTDKNLAYLYNWNIDWCIANDIPQDLYTTFLNWRGLIAKKNGWKNFSINN